LSSGLSLHRRFLGWRFSIAVGGRIGIGDGRVGDFGTDGSF
jgi:hypothetical protein